MAFDFEMVSSVFLGFKCPFFCEIMVGVDVMWSLNKCPSLTISLGFPEFYFLVVPEIPTSKLVTPTGTCCLKHQPSHSLPFRVSKTSSLSRAPSHFLLGVAFRSLGTGAQLFGVKPLLFRCSVALGRCLNSSFQTILESWSSQITWAGENLHAYEASSWCSLLCPRKKKSSHWVLHHCSDHRENRVMSWVPRHWAAGPCASGGNLSHDGACRHILQKDGHRPGHLWGSYFMMAAWSELSRCNQSTSVWS